jgi:hypothetical protein
LFTEQIPRPLFDVIVMTYRYEWRARLRPFAAVNSFAVQVPVVESMRR